MEETNPKYNRERKLFFIRPSYQFDCDALIYFYILIKIRFLGGNKAFNVEHPKLYVETG